MEYYRLALLRKPEYMGWSQTEPSTETGPTGFTLNNGNELQRRIDDYARLYQGAETLKSSVPPQRRDAYFQLVEYPLKGAALMNFKYLYAHQSMLAENTEERSQLAESARRAHDEIIALTNQYNQINHGKWNHMMAMNPRNLPVFSMPDFHLADYHLTDTGANQDVTATEKANRPVAIQASEYKKAGGKGAYHWVSIAGLGYSGAAVTLSPFDNHRFTATRPHLEYEFELEKTGVYPAAYEIQLRLLPTHANDFDFNVGLSVNGEPRKEYGINTQGRSEAWKENVLRNAVLVTHPVTVTEGGRQKLTIDVSHTGIVLDQIGVHSRGYGDYYEIEDAATEFQ